MKGKKPHPWLARIVRHRGRAAAGVVLAIGLSLAGPAVAWADDLSPASRNLFAAIERNDLAAVQASLAQGARLEAQNAFGLRPVDIAIDRGYYEIAHYLLSVHNARPAAEAQAKLPAGPTTGPAAAPPVPPPVAAAPLLPPGAADAPPKAEQAPPPVQQSSGPSPFDPQAIPEGARHPAVQGGGLPPTADLAPPPPPATPPPPQGATDAPQVGIVQPAAPPAATPPSQTGPSQTGPAKPAARAVASAPPKQTARKPAPAPAMPAVTPPPTPPLPPPAVPTPPQAAAAPVVAPPSPPDAAPTAAASPAETTAAESAVPYLSPTSEPPPPPDISTAVSMPPPPERPAMPAIAERPAAETRAAAASPPAPSAAPEGAPPADSPPPPSVVSAQPPATADRPATTEQTGFMSEVSARIQQATQSLDHTFEDFMGGWFFKWMGQRMGLVKKPAPAKKETQVAAATSPAEPSPVQDEPPDPLKIFGEAERGTPAPGTDQTADRLAAESQDSNPQTAALADAPPSAEGSALTAPPADAAKADIANATGGRSAARPSADDLSLPPGADNAPADPLLADLPSSTEAPPAPVTSATVVPPAAAKTPAAKPATPRPAAAPPKGPAKSAVAAPPKAVAEKPVALLTPPAEAAPTAPNPFAPDAVPPGADQPLVGDKVPILPEPPETGLPKASPSDTAQPDVTLPADTLTQPPPAAPKTARPSVSAKAAKAAKATPPAKPKAPADSLENLLGELATVPEQGKAPSTGAKKEGGGLFGLEGPADSAKPAQPSPGGGLFGLDGPATTVAPRTTATPREGGGGGGLFGLDGPSNQVAAATPGKLPRAVAKPIPNTVLTLGESVHITAAMPPEPSDPVERNYCVKKNHGTVAFCIEPVDWPGSMAKDLQVSSIMYQGARAIVRYDNEMATRFHAIFPTKAYGKLVAYYAKRFGRPTETTKRTIAPFAQPRGENPVTLWQRMDPLSNEMTTLEIRKYDDARGGFPDMRFGAILLYNAKSPPIFPALSSLDLMPTSAPN